MAREGTLLRPPAARGDAGHVAGQRRSPAGSGPRGREGPPSRPFPRARHLVQDPGPGRGPTATHALPSLGSHLRLTTPFRPLAPPNPSHCPPALPARTTLPEVLRGPGVGVGAAPTRPRGGAGTCRRSQPMRSPAGRSRVAVWRFCERPGLLVAQSVARRLGPSRWVRGSGPRSRGGDGGRPGAASGARDAAGGQGSRCGG